MKNLENYIPLENCKHGYLYKINSRNLDFGVFNKEKEGFIGLRTKFDNVYLFTEFHWDTGAPYGTVKPIEELQKIPDDIKIEENLTHSLDNLWALNPETNVVEEVVRYDLEVSDPPHGKRQLFEDKWVSSGARLPDDSYPYTLENRKLFLFLKNYE